MNYTIHLETQIHELKLQLSGERGQRKIWEQRAKEWCDKASRVKSIWVLTREINEYDQDGAYFEAAWPEKPTADQLVKHVENWIWGPDSNPVTVLLEYGGGRQGRENTWYNLFEHEVI
jgi:hypothetical protein